MFNFFDKQEETKQKTYDQEADNKEIIASICFYTTSEGKQVYTDVSIKDYQDSEIAALVNIMNVIGSDSSATDLLEIVKNGFINSGNVDGLSRLVHFLTLNPPAKLLNDYKQTLEEKERLEPCIKPSNMLK